MTPTLNSDMGEGFGLHRFGHDEQLMALIDAANVAAGFHAGDPHVLSATVRLAKENDVEVGAHPSFPDLVGFGRRVMAISPQECRDLLTYQAGAVLGALTFEGMRLSHIKPHGALYGVLSREEDLMGAAAEVCGRFGVAFYGLAGTAHEAVCREKGVEFVGELYVDLDYDKDGTLLIQRHAKAKTPDEVVARLAQAVETGTIDAATGESIPIRFDSVCVHSDGPTAVDVARACRDYLDGPHDSHRAPATGTHTTTEEGQE